jgi:hypothetical protein
MFCAYRLLNAFLSCPHSVSIVLLDVLFNNIYITDYCNTKNRAKKKPPSRYRERGHPKNRFKLSLRSGLCELHTIQSPYKKLTMSRSWSPLSNVLHRRAPVTVAPRHTRFGLQRGKFNKSLSMEKCERPAQNTFRKNDLECRTAKINQKRIPFYMQALNLTFASMAAALKATSRQGKYTARGYLDFYQRVMFFASPESFIHGNIQHYGAPCR